MLLWGNAVHLTRSSSPLTKERGVWWLMQQQLLLLLQWLLQQQQRLLLLLQRQYVFSRRGRAPLVTRSPLNRPRATAVVSAAAAGVAIALAAAAVAAALSYAQGDAFCFVAAVAPAAQFSCSAGRRGSSGSSSMCGVSVSSCLPSIFLQKPLVLLLLAATWSSCGGCYCSCSRVTYRHQNSLLLLQERSIELLHGWRYCSSNSKRVCIGLWAAASKKRPRRDAWGH